MYRPQDLTGFIRLNTDLKIEGIRADILEAVGNGFKNMDIDKLFENEAIQMMAIAHGLDAVLGRDSDDNK